MLLLFARQKQHKAEYIFWRATLLISPRTAPVVCVPAQERQILVFANPYQPTIRHCSKVKYWNSVFHNTSHFTGRHMKDWYQQYCGRIVNSMIVYLKLRRMRWVRHVARNWERRGVYRVLVGKPEGKRPLGRHRRRWEDNIKMFLPEAGCGGMDWIELAQDRDRWRTLVNAVMNLRVP